MIMLIYRSIYKTAQVLSKTTKIKESDTSNWSKGRARNFLHDPLASLRMRSLQEELSGTKSSNMYP